MNHSIASIFKSMMSDANNSDSDSYFLNQIIEQKTPEIVLLLVIFDHIHGRHHHLRIGCSEN